MHYGEIYKITNKTSGKSYIGQAKKYIGKYDTPWGTDGRWKSHVKEAISSRKDHCTLLNNAIRKYSADDFIVTKICDCSDKNDMEETGRSVVTNIFSSSSTKWADNRWIVSFLNKSMSKINLPLMPFPIFNSDRVRSNLDRPDNSSTGFITNPWKLL